MNDEELVKVADQAKHKAYAPYSKFRVGAALLTEDDKVYTGINIENASFGATNCAERTAIFKAVSEGECKIKAIAISSDSNEITYPCGICRQVIAEFGDDHTRVICSDSKSNYKTYKLGELLPNAFRTIDT